MIGRLRARAAANGADAQEAATSVGVGAATVALWLVVTGAGLALLAGYIGLAATVLQFVLWATLLGICTYLLMIVIDDVATSLFQRGQPRRHDIAPRRRRGRQRGGPVRRAAVRGTAAGDPRHRAGAGAVSVRGGLRIGSRPAERLRAWRADRRDRDFAGQHPALHRRAGDRLFLVRQFMGWLDQRYLPTTDLDGSVRNSIRLVARYVGIALAVIWSLASLGIGMERIALLLSALSVGIGFGLQAITSNFVSGLILLAERPIKIGDLIRVGTDEGDVKRINVRSTEIELADHSTLIVPNSELITKSVLNKTLSAPLGRIQVQFTVPIEADADRVRELVLETFAAEPAILDTPEAKAFIDGIADGRVRFNCFAHVESPRAAYSARSNVLIVLLRRMREAGSSSARCRRSWSWCPHSPPPNRPRRAQRALTGLPGTGEGDSAPRHDQPAGLPARPAAPA